VRERALGEGHHVVEAGAARGHLGVQVHELVRFVGKAGL
jgi:hypothetical protein